MRSKTLAVVLILAFAASVALASVTFTPPTKAKMDLAAIRLQPQKAAPGASGMASLSSDQARTKCVFAVEVKGLDLKKAYSARFAGLIGANGKVDSSKTQDVGTLKVDSKGTAKMVTQPGSCTSVKKWQRIQIVEHPDKNPKSTKNLNVALVGDLTQLK